MVIAAAHALVDVADASCVPHFNKMLSHPKREIMGAGLAGAKKVGDDSTVKILKSYVVRGRESDRSALAAMVGIGSPAARAALEQIAEQTKSEQIKEAVLAAIDEIDAKKNP